MSNITVNAPAPGKQYGEVNTTTNSVSFFDSQGNLLKLRFTDDMMNVSVVVPSKDANGNRKYGKEESDQVGVLLTKDRVSAMDEIFKTTFMEAITSKKSYRVGFLTNKQGSTMIEFMYDVGIDEISLLIHSEIDSDSRIPKKTTKFVFDKVMIINGFNPNNGEFESNSVQGMFYIFAKAVECYMLHLSGANKHLDDFNDRYQLVKMQNIITDIAVKLGVSSTGGTGFKAPTTNAFAKAVETTEPVKMKEMTLEEMSDDLPF